MSFKDRYIQGSYRGVPIFTQEADTTFGRQTAIYKLPFESRGVAHVDLGRSAREYSLRCIYVGPDYDKQRDALISALETAGSGKLVHPYLGRRGAVFVVLRERPRIRESTEDGGKCEITLEFIEARESNEPVPSNDLSAFARTKALGLKLSGLNAFIKKFQAGVKDFVQAADLEVLDTVLSDLRKVNGAIGAALDVPSHLAGEIDAISVEAATLINTPELLYNTIDATITRMYASIRRVANASARQMGNLTDVIVRSSTFGQASLPPAVIETADRVQQNINRSTMLISLRASALGSCSVAAVETEYGSANEAKALLETLVSALSDLSDQDINGVEPEQEVYDAVRDLIGALTQQLDQTAGSLSEVTTHRPADVLPAVLIAYQLYGDANRADEVLARNQQIRHPSFVPVEDLEVLTP